MIDLAALIGVLLVAGFFAGLVAGLLGVGGGTVMVPVLFQTWIFLGVDAALHMHLAVGTSLAAICMTSTQSVRAHARRGAVDFAALRRWSPVVIASAASGAVLARFITGGQLTLLFAVLAFGVAVRLMLTAEGAPIGRKIGAQAQYGFAALIGFFSSLVGIGGGMFSVPVFLRIGLDMRRAVATSSGIGLCVALPGALGFVYSGWAASGLPPYSAGFVSLPALVALIPTTIIGAPLGARIAHNIPRPLLRRIFAGFLTLTAARMFMTLF